MCGIAGVLLRDRLQPPDESVLRRMSERLAHRGPDGEGIWCGHGVGLVHRRLAIIDIEGGRQPMSNEDGSVIVTFNGELYNHESIRRRLESLGHRFATRSDTEVIVHLYEEVGDAAVEHLRGMFAFALWDATRERLLLARDRVGIKPLYYALAGDRLVFGSELKAVMADTAVRPRLDPTAVEDYLTFGFVPGAKSIYGTVRKVQAGHAVAIDRAQFLAVSHPYWQQPWPDSNSQENLDEWAVRVRDKVDESVAAHLLADVPVGAFLSGGIDSAIVVGSASRHVSDLRTFSIGFAPPHVSELPGARTIADRFHTSHAEQLVDPQHGWDMRRLVRHFDEPFADSSAVPTMIVSSLAQRSVKVVLSGDGGDEAFGGYSRYTGELREHAVRQRLPGTGRALLRSVGAVWPEATWVPRWLRARAFMSNLALAPGRAYAHSLSISRPEQRRALLRPVLHRALADYDPYAHIEAVHAAAAHSDDPLRGLLAVDIGVLLPDNYLVKVDRASMAVGLEVRPPMLDHELLELALQVPSRHKIDGNRTKVVLRQAFSDVLPSSTLQGVKRGFEMPVDGWFRRDLRDAFADELLRGEGPVHQLIDRGAVAALFDAHCRGRVRRGNLLWSLFVLSHWTKEYESQI